MFAFLYRLTVIVFFVMSLLVTGFFVLRDANPAPLLLVRRTNFASELWMRDLEHNRERVIPGTQFVTSGDFSWSPDGRWIVLDLALLRIDNGTSQNAFGLYAVNFLTGETQLVGDINPTVIVPAWSPDGDWLIFENVIDGQAGLYAVNVGVRTLTAPRFLTAARGGVVWSADGMQFYARPFDADAMLLALPAACLMQADCNATKWRIDKSFDQLIGRIPGSDALAVITSAPDSGDWTLNQVDLEQGTVSPLLTSVLPGVNPVWTADGRWLAAALIDRSDFGLFLTEVSTPGVYLINTQTHESTLIYEGIAGALAWTPDGDQLAFETFNPDTLVRSLRIYDRPTQTLRRIDTPGTLETAPHWSAFRGWHFAILPVIVGNLLLVGTLWLPQRLRYRRR